MNRIRSSKHWDMYSPQFSRSNRLREERRRKKHQTRVVRVVLSLSLCLFVFLLIHKRTPANPISSAEAQATAKPQIKKVANVAQSVVSTPQPKPATNKIQDALAPILKKYPALHFGISIYDYKTNSWSDINGAQPYAAGSTTKLLTAIAFLRQVQDGKESLDEMIGPYPASFQIQQLINQSNNDSWGLLNDKIGYPVQEELASEIGITSYKSESNTLSAHDMTLLLSRLYSGELLDADNTKLVLSYMQDTNNDSLIPKALPKTLNTYHKYGILEDTVNDGAIIEDGSHHYVVSIFSSGDGMNNYDERTEVFHALTKATLKAIQ